MNRKIKALNNSLFVLPLLALLLLTSFSAIVSFAEAQGPKFIAQVVQLYPVDTNDNANGKFLMFIDAPIYSTGNPGGNDQFWLTVNRLPCHSSTSNPLSQAEAARSFYGLYVTATSIGTVRLASFDTTCGASPQHGGGFDSRVSIPLGIFNLNESFTVEIVSELDDGFDTCPNTGCPAEALVLRGVTD